MTTDKKTLLLVDGSSYLYRAFHAMPDLRADPADPTSPATGAIRGMVNMLQKLRKDHRADYAACVFDAKGKTFRDDLYPAYKATRSPMPPDLRSQIEPVHEVVGLMGWPVLTVPGVEADDVIGTLACMASAQGIEVIISSGDKDLSQLVDQHITVIDTMNNKRRDLAGVEAEFGVPPSLMVDYQALVGDTVDNVPGVPKCGPKTAVKWLLEYGSLDNLVAHASDIKGVVGENLRASLDWLPQGKALVTIKKDCDLRDYVSGLPAMDTIAIGAHKQEALTIFYEKYGFKGLVKSLENQAFRPEPVEGKAPDRKFEPGLFDEPDVSVALPKQPSTLVFDTIFSCLSCKQLSWWRWTPKPRHSTRCLPKLLASAFPSPPAKRPTSRSPMTTPMRLSSCRVMKFWPGLNRG